MKKFFILIFGIFLLSGCIAKSIPKKESSNIDEPVIVTSSISMEITQEMINRFNARKQKE